MSKTMTANLQGTPKRNLSLEEFTRKAFDPAEKLFDPSSPLLPMWIVEASDGLTVMMTPWEDNEQKKQMVLEVKKLIKDKNASRYVHIAEVWMLQNVHKVPDSIKLGASVASHPEKKEAIIAVSEDRDGHIVNMRRIINRQEDGSASLENIQISHLDKAEGLISGLFKD